MFKKKLKKDLQEIFGVKNVTFNEMSEDYEQEKLFVNCSTINPRISSDKMSCRVEGSITVFAQDNKLPFGFFSKKIELAKNEFKKDFFFFDIDLDVASSPARIQNIHERRVSFIYIYQDQFDPSKGELTSLNMECPNG